MGKGLKWFGSALLGLAALVAISGVIGLTYVVTEVNQIPEGEGREKVRTLLELGSPLIIAVGVLVGVGVYCIAASRRAPAELP